MVSRGGILGHRGCAGFFLALPPRISTHLSRTPGVLLALLVGPCCVVSGGRWVPGRALQMQWYESLRAGTPRCRRQREFEAALQESSVYRPGQAGGWDEPGFLATDISLQSLCSLASPGCSEKNLPQALVP